MPRPEYYNLRMTEERLAWIKALARRLHLDPDSTKTVALVIDFALQFALYADLGKSTSEETSDDGQSDVP